MAKKSNVRTKITLSCVNCKERTYSTIKSRRNTPDKVVLKKHCPRCNKHTEHKEIK